MSTLFSRKTLKAAVKLAHTERFTSPVDKVEPSAKGKFMESKQLVKCLHETAIADPVAIVTTLTSEGDSCRPRKELLQPGSQNRVRSVEEIHGQFDPIHVPDPLQCFLALGLLLLG